MMPSSRTEFWVTNRNTEGHITPPLPGASATLKMVGLTMGTGDAWPAVDLAKVQFNQSGVRKFTSHQVVVSGLTDAAGIHGQGGIFKAQVPGASTATAATTAAVCAPLPQGHRRRIFFGFSEVAINNTFALGYEEVDQNGNVVPGTQKPAPDQLERFDPAHTTICLPLGPGQTPVRETWELIQLSTENHNFHLHQTRFVMAGSNGGVTQDNFPLGVTVPDPSIANQVYNKQNGVCTITQWRNGLCKSTPEVFDIPFAELGEFVYHCHILEHEDGGMMARIQVVPSPY
jgi:FtsP/CotA-like multicopper oxidase with cupredoxin domain